MGEGKVLIRSMLENILWYEVSRHYEGKPKKNTCAHPRSKSITNNSGRHMAPSVTVGAFSIDSDQRQCTLFIASVAVVYMMFNLTHYFLIFFAIRVNTKST